MAYDEGLAHRIRDHFEGDSRITEKKMFGGLAFLVSGAMAVGIIGEELMVRVGPDRHTEALARPHARPMDFTGRPMRGFVQVATEGFEDDLDLRHWLVLGVQYAEIRTREDQDRRPRSRPRRGSARSSARAPSRRKDQGRD